MNKAQKCRNLNFYPVSKTMNPPRRSIWLPQRLDKAFERDSNPARDTVSTPINSVASRLRYIRVHSFPQIKDKLRIGNPACHPFDAARQLNLIRSSDSIPASPSIALHHWTTQLSNEPTTSILFFTLQKNFPKIRPRFRPQPFHIRRSLLLHHSTMRLLAYSTNKYSFLRP